MFVGATASVAFGDYMTGANHVLPTGGLARSYSGLSTLDFVRWTTYQRVTRDAAARLADDVGVFADAEGLPGHASAARAWRKGGSHDTPPAMSRALARSDIESIAALAPDVTTCVVDVSDNVNLWGMPPAALRALTTTAMSASRYPSVYAEPLRDAVLHTLGFRRTGAST